MSYHFELWTNFKSSIKFFFLGVGQLSHEVCCPYPGLCVDVQLDLQEIFFEGSNQADNEFDHEIFIIFF